MSASSFTSDAHTQQTQDRTEEIHQLGGICAGQLAETIRKDWEKNVSHPATDNHIVESDFVCIKPDAVENWQKKWEGKYGKNNLAVIVKDIAPVDMEPLQPQHRLIIKPTDWPWNGKCQFYHAMVSIHLPEVAGKGHSGELRTEYRQNLVLPATWLTSKEKGTWQSSERFVVRNEANLGDYFSVAHTCPSSMVDPTEVFNRFNTVISTFPVTDETMPVSDSEDTMETAPEAVGSPPYHIHGAAACLTKEARPTVGSSTLTSKLLVFSNAWLVKVEEAENQTGRRNSSIYTCQPEQISTTPTNFGFTLPLPAKDTLIRFPCIHNMSPSHDQPPVSDGTSCEIKTIDGSTNEEPNADDRDRERVHRGLEKLADHLRIRWEMTVSAPKISQGNYVTQEKRKEWKKDCNGYLGNGAVLKHLGGAFKVCLGEVDEEDLRPLYLSDGRRAYPMFLTAFIQKRARSEGGTEPFAMVTVNIVLPSTWLLPEARDEWNILEGLSSLGKESVCEESNGSVCLLHPSSVDLQALVYGLNDQVTSIVDTLKQQEISYRCADFVYQYSLLSISPSFHEYNVLPAQADYAALRRAIISLHHLCTNTTNIMSALSSSKTTQTQEDSGNFLIEQHYIDRDCARQFATEIREDWESHVSCPDGGKHDEAGNILPEARYEWLEKRRGDHAAKLLLVTIFSDAVTKYSPAAGKMLNRKFSFRLGKDFGANWVSSPTYLAVVAVYLQPENNTGHLVYLQAIP
ncbi:hypothetical protein HD553DRAFT_335847 [Filobasidium floriforme]|uniref:uncharacterized protein n=1 Tax=Filobasidium floriforme TaxID=5210 RepID=UPI001E8E7F37|nr:uncharacterized protein HD553DRAFT_335847 [Filobasidium floriforme]KAH8083084.1 hypothetical protein HD553DRAFT_335847 [Filobasidium floriforme]